jgi:hypothetical protein
MSDLTKKDRATLNGMLKAVDTANVKLAAGEIKSSEHEALIRGVREHQELMRIRKIGSLTTPVVELKQRERNRVYAAGYENGFTDGLRMQLMRRTAGKVPHTH